VAPTADAVITIHDFGYDVPPSVSPGQKITVKNTDSIAHTVTDANGDAFDVDVPGNGAAHFTAPDKPGDYAVKCKYHSNMHATLVVRQP